MKKSLILPILALGFACSAEAAFTAGGIVVSRVGDGTNALVNSSGPISLLEFNSSGGLLQTVTISSTATSGLQISGSASSEGALSLSDDKSVLTIAGYNPPFTGTGSLANRTDAQAPRSYVEIAADGTVGAPVAVGAYSGNNIRSAVSTASGAYMAGGNSGTIYNDGVNTTIQSTVANTRVVNIQNGNLYFSTGSGSSRGVWGFTGVPTDAATPTAILNTGSAGDAYDFAFNDTNTIAYVADTRSLASGGGVQRWDNVGGTWSLTYTLTAGLVAGLTGLAVDFSGVNPIIYTVNPTTLFSLTDTGAGSSASTLASAGVNYAFRGLEFSPTPVPEPHEYALAIGALLFGLTVLRQRRMARAS